MEAWELEIARFALRHTLRGDRFTRRLFVRVELGRVELELIVQSECVSQAVARGNVCQVAQWFVVWWWRQRALPRADDWVTRRRSLCEWQREATVWDGAGDSVELLLVVV